MENERVLFGLTVMLGNGEFEDYSAEFQAS
jgi:hypothetical protein